MFNDTYCLSCDGTGEGQFDGLSCTTCKGKGFVKNDDDESFDIPEEIELPENFQGDY